MTHVLTALKTKRAEVAAQVSTTEAKLTKLRAALANLDAAMEILTPDHPNYIAKTRKRTRYFERNEFARMVRDALRKATEPLTAGQIASQAIAATGLPSSTYAVVTDMAKRVLDTLTRDGSAVKTGKARNARWAIACG